MRFSIIFLIKLVHLFAMGSLTSGVAMTGPLPRPNEPEPAGTGQLPGAEVSRTTKSGATTEVWVRGPNAFNRLSLSPKGKYLAFTNAKDKGLQIMDMTSKQIFEVSRFQVGPSTFWSPDGHRIFFRELVKNQKGQLESRVAAFDCSIRKRVDIETIPQMSGLLTFDPRDLRMHLLHGGGISTKRLDFPGERLAQWQIHQRTEEGKWLVAQNGVLWITEGGFRMNKLGDDSSPVDSFTISPDGSTMAWATQKGRIYISKNGERPKFYAHGRDPVWHPMKSILLFAGGRVVGNTIINHDLALGDMQGRIRFLTHSQFSDERWPQWNEGGASIIYTKSRTTDLFRMATKQ